MHRLFISSLATLALVACQPLPMPPAGTTQERTAAVLLQGRVMFPAFAIQALPGEVTAHAAIALIDGAGVTVAGGVTDSTGAFTLYQSDPPYVPVDGDFYTLEASRRSADGAMLTLRTTLQRQGQGWTSITGNTVVINLTTTAVAAIDAEDPAVTPAQTMGTVSGAAYDQVTAIGDWGAPRIAGRVTALAAVLAHNGDPNDSRQAVLANNIAITTAESLQNVQHVTHVTGNVVINTPSLEAVSLPRLRTVGGSLSITNGTNLKSVSLPSLQSVSSTVAASSNDVLESLSLPSLQSIGNFAFSGNAALRSLTLPSLQTVTLFQIQGSGLKHLDLPSLTTVTGPLTIVNNFSLETVSLPSLRTVGNFSIAGNTNMTELSGLATLASVSGQFALQESSQLTKLGSMPALTSLGTNLVIINTGLKSLASFSALTSVGNTVTITNNAQLETLGLSALTTVPGTFTVTGNGATVAAEANDLLTQLVPPPTTTKITP